MSDLDTMAVLAIQENAEALEGALRREGLKLVRVDSPDAMDLTQIGEALADAFTEIPDLRPFCFKESCGEGLPEEAMRMTTFTQHVYAQPPCGKREDADRLVELLDRLGFEIVRKETP